MRAFLVLIASFFFCAAPSAACSVDDSYKLPTNFELVAQAKVIVLARVKDVPPAWTKDEDSRHEGFVTLEPVRFLKGGPTVSELALMGWRPPKNWEGVSTATTLWQSHFSAGLGACIRQFYEPGELVLAIFGSDPKAKEITGKELNQLFEPWARVVETVDNQDDVWVHAVERYVTLQSGDPAATNQRIEAEIQQLRRVATPEAQAIAADLEYHLLRGERSGAWGSYSMPTLTTANVPGQKGAGLNCVAGTPPSLMLAADPTPTPPRLMIDGVAYPATAAELTPVERAMLAPRKRLTEDSEKEEPRSLYRLDPAAVGALRAAVKNVSVEVDGKSVISGRPLDALLRWASQCEKLQKLPAPTEEELRRSRM